MINKNKLIGASTLIALLMSGCASTTAVQQSPSNDLDVSSLDELKEVSIEARHELRILAKIRESKAQEGMSKEQHEQRYFQATHVPSGFGDRVDFSYSGTASETAKAVAAVAGYSIKFYGNPLPNEPWVRIVLKDQPLNEALKELGMQTGDVIRIEIHEAAKLMRFIYK
jgi:outer membrane murein-binding lipoprotein Lpp